MDRFDLILDEAARQTEESRRPNESEEVTSCVFLCPKLEDPKASWFVSECGHECLALILLFSI